jgi:hypothetical protein
LKAGALPPANKGGKEKKPSLCRLFWFRNSQKISSGLFPVREEVIFLTLLIKRVQKTFR